LAVFLFRNNALPDVSDVRLEPIQVARVMVRSDISSESRSMVRRSGGNRVATAKKKNVLSRAFQADGAEERRRVRRRLRNDSRGVFSQRMARSKCARSRKAEWGLSS